MTVHGLVEATAEPGQLDTLREAVRTFVSDVQEREAKARRVEAFTIEGTRTVLVHLVFQDALATEEHRRDDHTERFTEEIEDVTESLDLHELEPVTRANDAS